MMAVTALALTPSRARLRVAPSMGKPARWVPGASIRCLARAPRELPRRCRIVSEAKRVSCARPDHGHRRAGFVPAATGRHAPCEAPSEACRDRPCGSG